MAARSSLRHPKIDRWRTCAPQKQGTDVKHGGPSLLPSHLAPTYPQPPSPRHIASIFPLLPSVAPSGLWREHAELWRDLARSCGRRVRGVAE
eukprot:scaffold17575_cov117-Isochrysis_galbana.AAC.1